MRGKIRSILLLFFFLSACELVEPPTPPEKSNWNCESLKITGNQDDLSYYLCEGYNGTYSGDIKQRTMSDGSPIQFGEELHQVPKEEYNNYFDPHGQGSFKRNGDLEYSVEGSFSNGFFYNGKYIKEYEEGNKIEAKGEFVYPTEYSRSQSHWTVEPTFSDGVITLYDSLGRKIVIQDGDFEYSSDRIYLSDGKKTIITHDREYVGIGITYKKDETKGVEIRFVDINTKKESGLQVGDIIIGIEANNIFTSFENLDLAEISESFANINDSNIILNVINKDGQKKISVERRNILSKGCEITVDGRWNEEINLIGSPVIIDHPNGIIKATLRNGEISYGKMSIEFDPNRKNTILEYHSQNRSPMYNRVMGIENDEKRLKDKFSASAYYGSRSIFSPNISRDSLNLINFEYKGTFDIDKSDNSIVEGEVRWLSIFNCASQPEIVKEHAILNASDKRYLVNESPIVFTDKTSLEFKDYNEAPENWDKNVIKDSQIIYIELLESDADRKITKQETVQSTYRSGYREVYNVAYDQALIAVQRARDRVYSAEIGKATRNTKCGNANSLGGAILCSIIDNSGVNSAKSELEKALGQLNSTPRVLNEPVMDPHFFNKNYVKASKKTKVKISLIDHISNTYKEKIITSIEDKETIILDREIPLTDPKVRSHERNTMTEDELDRWIDLKPMPDYDSLRSLIRDVSNDGNRQEFRTALKRVTTKEKKKESIKRIAKSNNSKEPIIDYGNSVVVIEDLKGNSGAGFYIRDQLIMTNAHVVNNKKYLNIKSESGESFIGEVLMKDLSSDLAVINVKRKGEPIVIKPGCSVRRGEEVIAIGHPEGFEFSLTKGIISGLRTKRLFAGGKSVRVIQIDANITYGNSGGPLLDNEGYLVGVNSYGEGDADFLDFSIHCSEVEKFLQKNIP